MTYAVPARRNNTTLHTDLGTVVFPITEGGLTVQELTDFLANFIVSVVALANPPATGQIPEWNGSQWITVAKPTSGTTFTPSQANLYNAVKAILVHASSSATADDANNEIDIPTTGGGFTPSQSNLYNAVKAILVHAGSAATADDVNSEIDIPADTDTNNYLTAISGTVSGTTANLTAKVQGRPDVTGQITGLPTSGTAFTPSQSNLYNAVKAILVHAASSATADDANNEIDIPSDTDTNNYITGISGSVSGTTANLTVTVEGRSNITGQITGIPSPTGGTINVEDEGGTAVAVSTINFTGAGITATTSGTEATVNVPAGSFGGFTVQDSGTPESTTVTTLNFGDGLQVTGTGDTLTVTTSGGPPIHPTADDNLYVFAATTQRTPTAADLTAAGTVTNTFHVNNQGEQDFTGPTFTANSWVYFLQEDQAGLRDISAVNVSRQPVGLTAKATVTLNSKTYEWWRSATQWLAAARSNKQYEVFR